jgi:hypothetical protein
MKPVDPAGAVPVPGPKIDLTEELEAALAQRLWQELMIALPGLTIEGNPDQLAQVISAQAIEATSGSTQGHMQPREERERDASSALTSAAHMLAMTIPQLGLTRYQSDSSSAPQQVVSDQSWTVQLGHVDADGGNASVNVLHPLLGDIALDVELSQGSVRVIATVPNDYGARILLEGQAVLAERLLRQGVHLQVLDVLVRRKRKSKDSQPPRRRARKEDR